MNTVCELRALAENWLARMLWHSFFLRVVLSSRIKISKLIIFICYKLHDSLHPHTYRFIFSRNVRNQRIEK